MKTNYVIAVVAGAMALEAVIAYAFWPTTPQITASQESHPERRRRVRDVQESADAKVLRQRIRELEQRLAAAEAGPKEREERIEEPAGERRQDQGDNFGITNMREARERMERFARDNPARFAQVTNGMAQGMRRAQEYHQARTEFLSAVDTSKMTAEQKDVHSKYLEMTARQQELQEYFRPDANVTDEERQAAFDEMREVGRATRDLAMQERDVLLSQAAQNMGYTAEQADSVVGQIKEIYQATDNWGAFGAFGGFGGRGGRGGRGGGRGGRGGGRGR